MCRRGQCNKHQRQQQQYGRSDHVFHFLLQIGAKEFQSKTCVILERQGNVRLDETHARRIENPRVGGSIPSLATIFPRYLLIAAFLAASLVSACAPLQPRNPLATWVQSDNFDQRHAQLIVVHFTDEGSVAESLATLRGSNSGGPVSAHYLIGADGHIYQLVQDQRRAWHAGSGHWGSISDVNSASIGIELDNTGEEPFAKPQIDSLLVLLADLTRRHSIPCTAIIGHEDMAPLRKVDPGPLFPWSRLAESGFGLWPDRELVDAPTDFDPWVALALIGYPLGDRGAAVRSFHHRFRGMEGQQLDSQDLRILLNLQQKIVNGDQSCGAGAPAEVR